MNLSESWRNNKQDAKPKPFRLRWLISMTWRLCAVCLYVSMCVWMFNWVCGCVTVNMCFYTCLCLNPFTAIILKMTNKSANFEIIKVFSPVRMRLEYVKKNLLKCTVLKIDLLSDHQIHCFVGMYVCTFEPGNFKGRSSERVMRIQYFVTMPVIC